MVPEERRVRDRDLDRAILRELIELRKDINRMQQQIQDALAQLQTEVSGIRDTEQAAVTLIQGLQTQLSDALNSSPDPAEVVAAVQAVTNQLSQDAAPLAAAVANNTLGNSTSSETGSSSSSTATDTNGSSDTSGSTDTGSADATA
jgi:Rad3-related DNA helicase